MAKRYTPVQWDISPQHNRSAYRLVTLLWLHDPRASCKGPKNPSILKSYERIQHQDQILCTEFLYT